MTVERTRPEPSANRWMPELVPPPPERRWGVLVAPSPEETATSAAQPEAAQPEISNTNQRTVDEAESDPPSMASTASRRPFRRRYLISAFTLLAGAVAAALLLHSIGQDSNPRVTASPAAPPSTTATPSAPPPPSFAEGGACPVSTAANIVTGNGPGGATSGTDAILALQHAFYVARSGAAVRAVVEDGALGFGSAEKIQDGINTVPPGTVHCLMIREDVPGQYYVEVTERRPNNSVAVYRQAITTVEVAGSTLIHSYTALE